MAKSILSRVLMVLAGALLIITGVMIFKYPAAALVTAAFMLGLTILVLGIGYLIAYFTEKQSLLKPGWILAQGILDTLIGLLLLFNIGITTASLPFILAFWALFAAINRLIIAFSLKKVSFKYWWLSLVIGILGIILSILVIFNPMFGFAFIVAYIAVFMVYYGFVMLFEAFTAQKG